MNAEYKWLWKKATATYVKVLLQADDNKDTLNRNGYGLDDKVVQVRVPVRSRIIIYL